MLQRFKLLFSVQLLSIALFLTAAAPASAKGKLKVFILAGQSNMVGHANAHTAATLFQSTDARDKALIDLVFKKDRKISQKILDEQIARAKIIDDLSGGISNSKVKAITDAAEKQALEAKIKPLKNAHEAYKQGVFDSLKVSDRVYINSIADRNRKAGKLGPGYGGSNKKIGPEYAFGLSIAEKVDGPILLIKTSWGGKSINYNFRPPSAGPYQLDEKQKASDKAEEIKQNAGLNWRLMNEAVRNVLDNLKDNHPDYDPAAGYEVAGFVWFQGFNDQFSPAFRDNYKDNMIAFIKDIRKEYKTPNMPFVIGVLGTPMTKEKVDQNAVSVAQREAAKAPEFKGNVVSVESYKDYALDTYEVFKSGWAPHYHHWDTVGSDRPYHYLGSGTFFVRLGDSFANAMAKLIANQ